MKAITLLLLAFVIVYYGIFNHEKPILLFSSVLIFATFVYFMLIKGRIYFLNFRSNENIKMKDILKQLPIQLVILIGLYQMKLNTSNEILEIAFLILKGIVIIEFIVLFLMELGFLSQSNNKV